jgi:hypothetical protein
MRAAAQIPLEASETLADQKSRYELRGFLE